jgi:tetratricopeptide (TPR) repeat protein
MVGPNFWAAGIPFNSQVGHKAELAQSYYSTTLVSIAIGATLAISVPLILRERNVDGRKPRFGEPGLTIAWILNYVVFAYFAGGLLRLFTELHPLTCVVFCLGPFIAWHVALRVGRSQTIHRRSEELQDAVPAHDAAFRLIASIIEYARTLNDQHKDKALLDLHRNTTRMLHLLGANDSRVELGTLALHAAQRANDVEQESAILLDDLGWANFEAGRVSEARERIGEAIELLQTKINGAHSVPDALRVLLAKGNRHLAALNWVELDVALAHISDAEGVIRAVDPAINIREQAGLDIAYGYVVAENFTDRFGDGVLTENTPEGRI